MVIIIARSLRVVAFSLKLVLQSLCPWPSINLHVQGEIVFADLMLVCIVAEKDLL